MTHSEPAITRETRHTLNKITAVNVLLQCPLLQNLFYIQSVFVHYLMPIHKLMNCWYEIAKGFFSILLV